MKFKKVISALAAVSMLTSVFAANAFASITKESPVVFKLSYEEFDLSTDRTLKSYADDYIAYEVAVNLDNAPTNYDKSAKKGTAIAAIGLTFTTDGGTFKSGEDNDWWIYGGDFVTDTNGGSYVNSTSGNPLYNKNASTGDSNNGVDVPILIVKNTIKYIKFVPTAASITTAEYDGEQLGGTGVDYDLVNGLLKIDDTTAAGFEIGTKPAPTVKLDRVAITGEKNLYLNSAVTGDDEVQLTATAYNTDDTVNTTAKITWSVEGDAVEVDTAGKVTAKAVGEAKVTATAVEGDITKTATVTIGVKNADPYLKAFAIKGDATTVEEGKTLTLDVVAKDQYGADFAVDVEWKSSNEDVATVAGGVVTAKTAGKTTITANVKGMESFKSEKEITVTAKPVVNPVITIGEGVAVDTGAVKGFVWNPITIANYKVGTYTATFTADGVAPKTAALKGLPAIEGTANVTFAIILRTNNTGVKLGIDFAE